MKFREKLYKFVSEYISENNYSPTFAEITLAIGISPRSKSLITRNLRTLEKEGRLLLKKAGRRLLIELPPKNLPLLGNISAGNPIEALEDVQFIDTAQLFPHDNCFALKVKGTSMIDDAILDGDVIICRQSNHAKEGDIVVALIDQLNVTLKRVSYKLKGMITLIPANVQLKPRAYPAERIVIQGVYLGLIRRNS